MLQAARDEMRTTRAAAGPSGGKGMARTRAAGKAAPKKAAAKKAAARKPAPGKAAPKANAAPQASPLPQAAPLGYADLISMVELIERASAFSEFRLKVGAIEIEFRRRSDGAGSAPRTAPSDASPAAAPTAAPTAAPATATGDAAGQRPAAAPLPPGTLAITAPMVGTFYRAPAPGATPFVEVGQRVEAGATLCIIEVMKLMNTVNAASAGTVVEIRARDATPVAHDEVLIVFRPEA
jgi:acetyl-CoA carboxylase biotin carboxyl carrier protein